jgi:hypothetical protein
VKFGTPFGQSVAYHSVEMAQAGATRQTWKLLDDTSACKSALKTIVPISPNYCKAMLCYADPITLISVWHPCCNLIFVLNVEVIQRRDLTSFAEVTPPLTVYIAPPQLTVNIGVRDLQAGIYDGNNTSVFS